MTSLSDALLFELSVNEISPATHVEPERVAELYAKDVVRAAFLAQRPVWLIIDELEESSISNAALRFVSVLFEQLVTPSPLVELRVVLLKSRPIYSLLNKLPVESRFELKEITRLCLANWLMRAVPGKDEAVYMKMSEIILKQCERKLEAYDNPERVRLKELARQTSHAHRMLLAHQ